MQDKAEENYTFTIEGKEYEYPAGTTFREIAKDFQKDFPYDIVLVYADGKLQELYKSPKKGCVISFVTTTDKVGNETYRRSCSFLMLKAVYDTGGHDKVESVTIRYSLSKGLYCTIKGDVVLDGEFLARVRERMQQLVETDLPIAKRNADVNDAFLRFEQYGMHDKVQMLKYRQSSKVNVYSINEFEDYFYGYMVPSTGYLKYFDLFLYDEGFVLQLPVASAPKEVPPFEPQHRLFEVLKDSERWGEVQEITTIGDMNDMVTKGRINELVLVQEALQEKRIAQIAEQAANKEGVKFIFIAGPSSSGKTTFSHRLSIQLRTLGLKPHPIACDNYFVERDDTPRDESGEFDFEHIDAVDRKLLNRQLSELLAGETVKLPTFNFELGKKEYLGNTLKLGDDDILVIEGIHCLNDALTETIDPKNKFKIYISALTTLNIDEHNRIPTTDGRLIRRMVRDNRTRGTAARGTIGMWPSVRRGEERNIFPFQEGADAMFNSALIYELAVLKQYCEPLLYCVPTDCPEYIEAKRLLKFFTYVVGFGSDHLPANSLIREFIGGSCFNV